MHDDTRTRLDRAAREISARAVLPPPHAARARGDRRRRRRALGSGLLALALAAGSGTAYLTVARQQAGPPLSRHTSAARAALPAGRVGTRSAVPWPQVGPGWTLAEYTQRPPQAGPGSRPELTTLYLVDPLGGRYQMYRWPVGRARGWELLDWSSHGTRALFVSGNYSNHVHQLVLATGAMTSFTLPVGAGPIGYARPNGTSLLVASGNLLARQGIVQRFSLAGVPQATLLTAVAAGGLVNAGVVSPNGSIVAAGTLGGIEFAAVAGGKPRRVTLPGSTRYSTCHPVRWWDASTVLAGCDSWSGRLWLVPTGGGAPSALPVAPSRSFGYDDAWQVGSSRYLLRQAEAGCSTIVAEQRTARSATPKFNVRGVLSVLAAVGDRMLATWDHGCSPGWSLVWFNPATGAPTTLLPTPARGTGVSYAVPYGGRNG